MSAKQKNSSALCSLGNIYNYGIGVEQNYTIARQYYESVTKQNNSDSLNNLGNIYYYSYDVKQN